MIIKREYVRFIDLINSDKKAKEVFIKAFESSYKGETKERKEEIFGMLSTQCLYQRDMGWCFKNIGDLIQGFEKLDIEEPYNNGMTFSNVNKLEIVEREDDRLVLHLINIFDGEERIVAIKELEAEINE